MDVFTQNFTNFMLAGLCVIVVFGSISYAKNSLAGIFDEEILRKINPAMMAAVHAGAFAVMTIVFVFLGLDVFCINSISSG